MTNINPNPGILLYTRIKKSPYYYGSRRHGVQLYSVYNHHYHPRHYGDPLEEYWQLLEGVTLWDVGGAERQVEITGPDAFTFTNILTPRDLHKCAVGQCKYAFITDQHGGIINDPVLIRRELDGMPLVITRTGYTGELGYEIYLSQASRHGVRLWDALLEAGEPHGLVPIGPSHIRRIEGGILAHGCDMTVDENPYEVGYGYKWMVELEQEQDFIGREALKRVSEEGVSRKLVGVEIGGGSLGAYNDGSMPDFFPVHRGGQKVGKVTSACYSPRLDKNIGFAMVPIEHAEIGIELEVERPEETVSAVVADRVFFKPEHAEQELSATSSNKGA